MFKKLLQLKTLLIALLVMTGAGNVWGEEVTEVTYTFTSMSWGATPANWTSGNDGAQLTKGQGIQVTTGASGANGTSPVSYSNISKIVVKYCTNANKGAGTIKVKVGDGTEKSFTVSKPSSGGTTLKDATFNFSPVETGKVKVTVNCSANSVYIHSVTITYSSGSTTEKCATPTFSPAAGTYTSAQDVTISTETTEATIYYTTDGTDPTTSSSVYSTPISVSATTTIKAMAAKKGMTNSNVATATYVITDNAAPSHNVTWSVNGETTVESYKEGASISFPEDPADINGKTFVGWVTNAIAGTTDTAPSFVTSPTMGTNDVTYYAVFADLSTENSGWNATPLDSITSTDVFVIAAGSYAMSNNGGTGKAPAATLITVADKKITSEVAEKLKWNVSGNATDGYTFYPNGSTTTWLYCNTTASSKSNDNIRVGTGNRKSWVFNNSGYLVTNDNYTVRYLSLYGSQDFRGYTGTGNGAFVPKFYKYVGASYSAYCTSVIDAPTASKAACEFDTPFDVTITSEEGTTLKYTTDGTEPAQGTAVDANSVVLSIPAATTRVRAIALLNGASSPELDVTYTYNPKVAPTLTVPASVDLKVNETGKTITVTTNSDGAVTFESSDDNHLLVDNTTDNKVGELLADAEGTYTVTVTVAETENFRSATAYVTVNVTDSNPIRSATFTFNGQYSNENIKNGITNSKVHFICGGDADRFAISTAIDYKGQLAIYRKTDNTTNAGCFTISSADDNYAIVKIELNGTNTGSLSTDVSSYGNSIWQGNSSSVTFTNNTTGTQCYISDITVLYARVTPLSVTAAGYATFSSTSALDFTNVEDIHAYTATVNDTVISFTRVYKVPAETGLLLRSVNEGAVSTRVPLYDGATYDVTDNAFVAATEEIDHLPTTTTDGKYTNYILYKPSDGIIGFYQANNQRVGAGKAYLHVSSEQATTRAFIAFSFDDPETGIAQIETLPQQGVAYDLQGRRVNAPKGGLYIINGKKVIVK